MQNKETTAALITEFNMWSREMSVDELNTETCSTQGDVVSWTGNGLNWGTLTEEGSSTHITNYITTCSGKVFKRSIYSIIDVFTVVKTFYKMV